jgi:hypothetical protein
LPQAKYDVLYHVSDGNVELYNPQKHGIWEIYKNKEGVLGVRQVQKTVYSEGLEPVRDWSDILDNLRQFKYVSKKKELTVHTRLSQFFHWYYFPKDGSFVPSKFLGYRNMTAESYMGKGHGGHTQKYLEPYFVNLDKKSKQFKELHNELNEFLGQFGKKASAKVLTGTGGIYVPVAQYAKKQEEYSQGLYDQVSSDIESFNDEIGLTTAQEGKKNSRPASYFERSASLRAKAIKYPHARASLPKDDLCGMKHDQFSACGREIASLNCN